MLTQDEKSIKALAECKQSTIFVESKLAEWNDSLERWENFNVEVRNSEIIEFCQPRVLQDYLIWAEELTYKQIFDYCRRMGGTLPSISYEKPLTAGKYLSTYTCTYILYIGAYTMSLSKKSGILLQWIL